MASAQEVRARILAENERKIAKAFESGREADGFAYVGTTLKALLKARTTGQIEVQGDKVDVTLRSEDEDVDTDAWKTAEGTASIWTQVDELVGRYPPLADVPAARLYDFVLNDCMFEGEDDAFADISALLPEGSDWASVNTNSDAGGVVLILSADILKQYELVEPTQAWAMPTLATRELPLSAVVGIEPVRHADYVALAQLQDRVDPPAYQK